MRSNTAMRPTEDKATAHSDQQHAGQVASVGLTWRPHDEHPWVGAARVLNEQASAFPLVRGPLWAWEDLNLRPHPYQQSRAYRHANRRSCRSLATVRGEVMRCLLEVVPDSVPGAISPPWGPA
jgi:hypothetical protein